VGGSRSSSSSESVGMSIISLEMFEVVVAAGSFWVDFRVLLFARSAMVRDMSISSVLESWRGGGTPSIEGGRMIPKIVDEDEAPG
jgi:hypothetical protein